MKPPKCLIVHSEKADDISDIRAGGVGMPRISGGYPPEGFTKFGPRMEEGDKSLKGNWQGMGRKGHVPKNEAFLQNFCKCFQIAKKNINFDAHRKKTARKYFQ